MKISKRRLGLAAYVLFFTAGPLNYASAEQEKAGRISISATGTAAVVPDMAILNLTVQREAKTARKALSMNNIAMRQVLDAMKTFAIEDRDLQTSNFNIQPRYVYPVSKNNQQPAPPRIVGYIVSNSLTVRVNDLARLGEILDRSVTMGVNGGGGLSFTTKNPDPAIESARKNAMARAIAKATILSEAAGAKLGRILEISEQGRRPPRPRSLARAEASFAKADSVPISSGENSYSVTVNVQWELQQ